MGSSCATTPRQIIAGQAALIRLLGRYAHIASRYGIKAWPAVAITDCQHAPAKLPARALAKMDENRMPLVRHFQYFDEIALDNRVARCVVQASFLRRSCNWCLRTQNAESTRRVVRATLAKKRVVKADMQGWSYKRNSGQCADSVFFSSSTHLAAARCQTSCHVMHCLCTSSSIMCAAYLLAGAEPRRRIVFMFYCRCFTQANFPCCLC